MVTVSSALRVFLWSVFFFFQAEDGIRDKLVTGVQTCALPIYDIGCQTVLGRRGRRDRADGGDGHSAAPGAALLLGEELGEVARGGRARERHGVDRARGERLPQAAGAVLDAPGLVEIGRASCRERV